MKNQQIPSMAVRKKSRSGWILAVPALLLVLAALVIFLTPDLAARANYHFNQLRAKVFYFFRRPQEQIFVPGQSGTAQVTGQSPQPEQPPEPTAISTAEIERTESNTTPSPTATPTPQPSPQALPEQFLLEEVSYEKQGYNNCGPTTLGILLRYWGVHVDQMKIADFIHQIPDDRNVSLSEMRDYVLENTELKAMVRYGGNFDLIRRLVSSGFPVMLERGFYTANTDEWMGHYGLVTGYDRQNQTIHVPDTYHGETDFNEADLERLWMHFSYAYLLVYPADQEEIIQNTLGMQWDEAANAEHALRIMQEKASIDFPDGNIEDKFFAKFGVGETALLIGDYKQAGQAFDDAFREYAQLPSYKRPFRVMWYQFGPYEAYFKTERFEDCANLAQNTIANSSASGLEESWYWRGRCVEELGDINSARFYYKKALEWHPGWQPAQAALDALR